MKLVDIGMILFLLIVWAVVLAALFQMRRRQ